MQKAETKPAKGSLYGIPFVAKDNFDSAGIPTSGGSAALEHSVPSANAFVVQKLIDQGAILLGKANMSELAASYDRFGYSSAGGLTLNPYNTARDVSGSSSGSAAAVAADFAAFALGTDTSGSLRGAGQCRGFGRAAADLGPDQPQRRHPAVADIRYDRRAGAQRHATRPSCSMPSPERIARDAATLHQPKGRGSYVEALRAQTLRGARLGVIDNFRGANSEVDGIEQAALRELRAQGAVLIPVTLPKEFEHLWHSVLGPVGEAEFKPQFERYLRTLSAAQPKTLAQLIGISASRAVADSLDPGQSRPPRGAATGRHDAADRFAHLHRYLDPGHSRATAATADPHGREQPCRRSCSRPWPVLRPHGSIAPIPAMCAIAMIPTKPATSPPRRDSRK